MALTVTKRPQKSFYDGDFVSWWSSLHLPVRYELTSDLFPVNTVDDIDVVSSVVNSAGYVQLNLAFTYETYEALEWVKISGFTEYADGVYQIIEVKSATEIVLNLRYVANDTGSVQRYYQNYRVLARLYAGLPLEHPSESLKPMELITESPISVTPNGDSVAVIDVATLLRSQLNFGDAVDGMDMNHFVGFSIEFAEAWDESNGEIVTQFVTAYQNDSFGASCQDVEFVNEGFEGSLAGWSQGNLDQGGANSEWAYGSDSAVVDLECSASRLRFSKYLFQNFTVQQGITYVLEATASVDAGCNASISFLWTSDGELSLIGFGSISTTPTVVQVEYTPPFSGVVSLGMNAKIFDCGCDTGQTVTATSFTIRLKDAVCNVPTLYGMNGTFQLGTLQGGSFGLYELNNIEESKLLHPASTIACQEGYAKQYSFILSVSLWYEINQTGELYLMFEDLDGNQSQTLIDISSGWGLYRVPYEATKAGSVWLRKIPFNLFTAGDDGTMEANIDGFTSFNDYQITQSTEEAYEGTHSLKWQIPSEDSDFIFASNTANLNQGSKIYRYVAYLFFPTLEGCTFASISVNDADSGDELHTSGDVLSSLVAGIWNEVYLDFEANQSDVDFRINIANGLGDNALIVYVDSVGLFGPLEDYTERKALDYDSRCLNNAYELKWMNSLGGFDSFTFGGNKEYSTDFGDVVDFQANIYNEWDSEFISGRNSQGTVSIEAKGEVLVRSQKLSKEQYFYIFGNPTATDKAQRLGIMEAIQVLLVEDGKEIDVLIDRSSFKKYEDYQKQYEVEFTVYLPKYQIQRR
jgi:hypothetical protein